MTSKHILLIIPTLLLAVSIWTLSSLEPSLDWSSLPEVARSRPVRQVTFALLAIGISFGLVQILAIHRKFSRVLAYSIICIILCIVVIVIDREVRGASRWIKIGDYFSLQPSELLKVGVVMWVAYFGAFYDMRRFWTSIWYWSVPLVGFLIIWNSSFGQSDLGTSIILILPAIAVYFVHNRIPGLYKIGLAASLILAVTFISINLVGYQQRRLEVFDFITSADSWTPQTSDSINRVCNEDTLYNTCHSVALVANHNLFGSIQSFESSKTIFLPERQTDFIYASLSHFLGITGSFAVALLFFLLFGLLLRMLPQVDEYKYYLIIGVFITLSLQVILNIGMNLGLIPVVGVPLPWVSYGGSQLLSNFLMIFLVLSQTKNKAAYEVV